MEHRLCCIARPVSMSSVHGKQFLFSLLHTKDDKIKCLTNYVNTPHEVLQLNYKEQQQ